MLEIRWHGRGGQGAVTSVELFALAAIAEGKFASGFPSFGTERRGAPVTGFNRVDDKQIKIRSGIYHPDVVVVLDESLEAWLTWRRVSSRTESSWSTPRRAWKI